MLLNLNGTIKRQCNLLDEDVTGHSRCGFCPITGPVMILNQLQIVRENVSDPTLFLLRK